MDAGKINGTAAVWEHSPGPFRATVTFRAGYLHEPLPSRGAAEVIGLGAHAAAAARAPRDLDVGVEIAPETTSFYAIGERQAALAHLSRVAATLSDPSLRAASASRPSATDSSRWGLGSVDLLAARTSLAGTPSFEEPLNAIAHRLFGHTGVGRRGGVRPPITAIGAPRVGEVARRCFHASNAMITLTGAPPTQSDFRLPTGGQPPFPESRPTGHPRPATVRLPIRGAAIAVDIRHDACGIALLPLLLERVTAAARRRGMDELVIDPGVLVSRDQLLMTYVIDSHPSRAALAADALVDGLRSLVAQPVTEADLARVREHAEGRVDDPDQLEQRLDEAGAAHLADFGPQAVLADEVEPPTSESVTAVAARALASAVLILPLSAASTDLGIGPDRTRWRPPSDRPASKASASQTDRRPPWRRGAGLDKVVHSEHGLTATYDGRPPEAMAWQAVAGVERDGDVRRLHAVDGRCLEIDGRDVHRPDRLLAAIDDRTQDIAWDLG